MSLAAVDLKDENAKVIDVALKYGYDSPTAFNRAFQTVHGVTPSQARANNISLKAFPPITFHMTVKGGQEMNYRIENREVIRVVGKKSRLKLLWKRILRLHQSSGPKVRWMELLKSWQL